MTAPEVHGCWYEVEAGGSKLQASLAAGTATCETYAGHHPLTCRERLTVHEDGVLECPHGRTGPADARTQMAIDQSIAHLLMEMVHERDPG